MAVDHSGFFVKRTQRVRPVLARFIEKILLNSDRIFDGSPCWEWQAAIDGGGYGRLKGADENFAHRVSHVLFLGRIPEGSDVDHKCRNRRCVSPFHLQAVTHKKNTELRNEAKTHCKKGHEFNKGNTYQSPTSRVCKACRYEAIKRWRAKHPEQAREVYRIDKAQYRAKGGLS